MKMEGGHLFTTCHVVKKVWSARLAVGKCTQGVDENMLRFGDVEPYADMLKLSCWWTERNRENRGERRHSLNELKFCIRMHAAEWREFLMKKPAPLSNRIVTWEAPPAEWVLINSDGAFKSNQGKGGWGIVGRDSESDMVFAAAGAIQHTRDAPWR